MKLDREQFFKEFRVTEEQFLATGLDWNELEKIYYDYLKLIPFLEKEAEHIVSKLIDMEKSHSVRRRVKKPKHLIEKIIRKGTRYAERGICSENYMEIITDLIGIRVLHLFKDDWKDIHHEISNLWELKETPQINLRRGDNIDEVVSELSCEVVIRDHGYRSVHYLVQIPVTKNVKALVEIQVRTVFEEAWSEIDHITRYPYDMDNPILIEYLAIFNRIVGSADEMGTFLKKMKKEVGIKKNGEHERELDIKFR